MTISILHLEDDPLDAELIGAALRAGLPGLELRHVATRDDYVHSLLRSPPDVILADYRMPGFDGPAALEVARELAPSVPFIVVSGTLGEEPAVETLKQGAADYILKARLQRLVPAVISARHAAQDRERRLQAESALRSQQQLLRALVNSLPDMIYAVDHELRVTVMNRAMLEALGRTEEEVVGRPLGELMRLDEIRPGIAEDSHLMANGRSVAGRERPQVVRDGERRWFVTSKSLLMEPDDGRVVGLVHVRRDVTARRRLEHELADASNREQRRIGADIHDGLGQELTGLSLLLRSLETRIEEDPADAIVQVQRVRELAQQAIGTARALARGLAPVELERGGLEAALRHLAAQSEGPLGIRCSVRSPLVERLPIDDDTALHLYRIVQESIANAARHGGARNVDVRLWRDGERVHLEIADDGRGFSPRPDEARRDGSGMGLRLMRYRAGTIGADLRIVRNEPQGALVQCSFALPDQAGSSTRPERRAMNASSSAAGIGRATR